MGELTYFTLLRSGKPIGTVQGELLEPREVLLAVEDVLRQGDVLVHSSGQRYRVLTAHHYHYRVVGEPYTNFVPVQEIPELHSAAGVVLDGRREINRR